MNLFTATTLNENAPIGTQSWYSMVPLIQLSFPSGTNFDPTMTCKDFLAQIMGLEVEIRSRILNMDIPVVAEQVEEAKREGHKSLLVGVIACVVVASVLITGGYIVATSHLTGAADAGLFEKFTTFILEILKMLVSMLSGSTPTA